MAKFNKGRVEFETEAAQGRFGYVQGTTKWAQVLEVDNYGNFSVNLYGNNIDSLASSLAVMRDAAYEEVIAAGKPANKVAITKIDDEGKQFIGFKLPEKNFKGEENKITMYDVYGNVVEDWDKLVGNGSEVKIKYFVKPYYMSSTKNVGLSYKFYAMQVIKLNEYKAGKDSGFGDESSNVDTGFGNESTVSNPDDEISLDF